MKKLITFENNEMRLRNVLYANAISVLGIDIIDQRLIFDDYILYQFLMPARIRMCWDYNVVDPVE